MKFQRQLLIYTFLAIALINPAYSDVANGKELSASCVACHGDNGISLNPVGPKLAGQNPKYLEAQLHEFKKGPDGNRNNAVMYGIAMTLSDSDKISSLMKRDFTLNCFRIVFCVHNRALPLQLISENTMTLQLVEICIVSIFVLL